MANKVSVAQQRAFLAMIAPICQEQAQKHQYKLYASVAIAQAIHESGWGTSKKMVAANALFGIKVGKTGTTEYYDGKTATKITDYFRQYSTIADAVEDYMDMLCHCSRYKKSLNCASPEESIKAIIAGGYATGPAYVNAIVNLINTYNLKKYDQKGQVIMVNPYTSTNKTLRRGDRGTGVRYLQWFLDNKGYKLKIDGSFGPTTEEKVMDFQKDHGLVVDGIVGRNTWAALRE